MNVLVVYDSKFGNTETIAHAIGDAMRPGNSVDVRPIDDVKTIPAGLDLLIIGGPTQAHGVNTQMRGFLEHLPDAAVQGLAVAAFDTRLRWPKLLSGAASHGIAERLEHKGARVVTEPESFLVERADGPLLEGERERAASWGKHLVGTMAGRS